MDGINISGWLFGTLNESSFLQLWSVSCFGLFVSSHFLIGFFLLRERYPPSGGQYCIFCFRPPQLPRPILDPSNNQSYTCVAVKYVFVPAWRFVLVRYGVYSFNPREKKGGGYDFGFLCPVPTRFTVYIYDFTPLECPPRWI